MLTSEFDYALPPELIAQFPTLNRGDSRLLVMRRESPILTHQTFPDLIHYLRPGDLLVLNDSRVIPARLRGVNSATGGQFELLLLEETGRNAWWAMVRPGKRARMGTVIELCDPSGKRAGGTATVDGINEEGHRHLQFSGPEDLHDRLSQLGEIPLPPYIARTTPAELTTDNVRYQTVYAAAAGSVAAPTAGLHFTADFLARLGMAGVQTAFVTLHVGLGTFAPVKAEQVDGHTMHEVRFLVGEAAAAAINSALDTGRRIIAVGTTSVRVLESVATAHQGRIVPGAGRTRIFLHPPCRFQVVQGLLTNFHLPRSTLLMLVSAFSSPGETGGRARVLEAYATAVRERYRFFSYGDAMLIL